MAFWDDFSKKATETSQKALKKTKDMANVAKLSANLMELKKKLENSYTSLGRMYYQNHNSDFELCFSEIINEIQNFENKINDLNEEISKLKGYTICPNCNANVPSGSMFCSSCGTKIPVVENISSYSSNKCGSCGAVIDEGAAFCTNCGKKVEGNKEETIDEPIIEDTKERVCSSCGKVFSDDTKFCDQCGTKL